MLPAGLTTEKYVLKHCNGLPLHGPTEIYFTYNLVDFSLKLITNMILAISQSCNQHKPFPTSVNNIDEAGLFATFSCLPSGMRATDIVATFNNNFNIFSQSKEMVSSL